MTNHVDPVIGRFNRKPSQSSPKFNVRLSAILALILFICVGCVAPQITRAPDLGDVSNYPYNFKAGELLVGFEFPENVNEAQDENIQTFREFDLLILNIKIANTGENVYIISRDNISLILGSGEKYTPLRGDRVFEAASGMLGLRLLFLVELERGYQSWGLPESHILVPGDVIRGYLFFRVGEQYDKIKDGTLQISTVRAKSFELLEYSKPVSDSQ